MSRVTNHVWVGSFDEAFIEDPAQPQWTHILNVASEINVSERIGRVYCKCAVNDDDPNENIREVMPQCIAFIHSAVQSGGIVLVHCWEGKSRSVCAVLAYMCAHLDYTLDDAYIHVKERRPCVDVFPPYWQQLTQFCSELPVLET